MTGVRYLFWVRQIPYKKTNDGQDNDWQRPRDFCPRGGAGSDHLKDYLNVEDKKDNAENSTHFHNVSLDKFVVVGCTNALEQYDFSLYACRSKAE